MGLLLANFNYPGLGANFCVGVIETICFCVIDAVTDGEDNHQQQNKATSSAFFVCIFRKTEIIIVTQRSSTFISFRFVIIVIIFVIFCLYFSHCSLLY